MVPTCIFPCFRYSLFTSFPRAPHLATCISLPSYPFCLSLPASLPPSFPPSLPLSPPSLPPSLPSFLTLVFLLPYSHFPLLALLPPTPFLVSHCCHQSSLLFPPSLPPSLPPSSPSTSFPPSLPVLPGLVVRSVGPSVATRAVTKRTRLKR